MNIRLITLLFLYILSVPLLKADDTADFGPWEIVVDDEITPLDRDIFASSHIIAGTSAVNAADISRFISRHNPAFDPDIASAYIDLGSIYGIKGDVAICQAIVETGWFTFTGGTAVTPDQHNYCGLGVIRRGHRGATFATIADGVRAHLQHLYAYISSDPLPEGETCIDPRFSLVSRGCASTWHDLNGRWAANQAYGSRILNVYSRLIDFLYSNNQ